MRAAAAAVLVLLAACSSGGGEDAAPTTEVITSTTLDNPGARDAVAGADEPAYAPRGPLATGFRLAVGGIPGAVWYPADPLPPQAETPVIRYRISGFLDIDVADEAADTVAFAGESGASPAGGPSGVVVLAHDTGGHRHEASLLATHLASWGLVVVVPDDPSADSLVAARDALAADADLGPVVEGSTAVAVGRGDGADPALAAAAGPGFAGVVVLGGAVPPPEGFALPSLFVAAGLDATVPVRDVQDAWAAAPVPTWLWTVDDAGPLLFTDVCVLPAVPPGFDPDGCGTAPQAEVRPFVHHAVTAFARWATGLDERPAGLDNAPDAAVTVNGRA